MRADTLALLAALLVPTTAHASEVAHSGSTVTYTAAPGEQNKVLVSYVPYETLCGAVGTPCLSIFESGARITAVHGGCELSSSDPIAGDTARCPLPSQVVASLGDRDDAFWDWDGPSTIDAGAGNDSSISGAGGDDVIRGGIGSDLLLGEEGNDTLDGGPGDDYLEGISWVDEYVTHGRDTYSGGGGSDTLTYDGRSESLMLSPDGVADDGAPGEGDNIGADITTIVGGHGSDTLTGNANRNIFGGGEGDDSLTGAGGDDQLAGGPGADRLTGDAGQDVLGGDSGDDTLNGGEGIDRFYGDDVGACLAYSCSSGQDLIHARDGTQEQINCGAGTDAVIGDANDLPIDNVYLTDQCESLDGIGGAAPAASTPPPAASAPGLKATASRRGRRITIRVSVPGAGTVVARAGGRKVSRKVRAAGNVKLTLNVKARTIRVSFTPRSGPAQFRTVKLK